jgi:DnaK suppressor protein
MAERLDLDLEEIREKLEKEHQELLARIAEKTADASGGNVINPDRTDLARSYDLRQRDSALESWAERNLTRVEQALDRLDQGTYGFCENCGEPISADRLKALPHATMCMKCKSKLER